MTNGNFTYDFIVWALGRFVRSSLPEFAKSAGWDKNTVYSWKNRGVPKSLLVILEERLINLKITGKISCEQSINLDDLFKEYQTENKKK